MKSENLEKQKPLIDSRILMYLAAVMVLLLFIFRSVHAETQWPRVAVSKDGTPISYEVFGSGDPALAFVHGWSCDARYWRSQVPVFSRKHRVMVLDLAGHGHSGTSRTRYTMKAFGEDVQAVIQAAGSRRVILIGHSMGGSVIAAAVFEKARIPVVTVNGDLWPVNHEANRRHMLSFDAIVLKNADHFLMMTRPDDFNKALEKAVIQITSH
jgi:pimeloyl-ACP methyl ester carboxylesterase